MKKKPVFVAVSNQKGGVGKSTMLVALASLLNYTMDKSVAIVDCDATQRSLYNLRERDKEMVEKNNRYMTLLEEQRLRGCKIYPIKRVRPEEAAPQQESLLKLESMTSFLLTSQVLWMSPEFYRPFSMWIMF